MSLVGFCTTKAASRFHPAPSVFSLAATNLIVDTPPATPILDIGERGNTSSMATRQDVPPPSKAVQEQMVALLAWYQAAGVDCALGETPHDWLTGPPRAPGVDFAWPGKDVARQPAFGDRRGELPGANARGPSPPASAGSPPASQAGSLRQPAAAPSAPSQPRPRPPEPARPGTLAPPARFASGAPDAAASAARRIAEAAGDIAALESALKAFEGCALKATAKSTCVYRGAHKARVMIIGEAPGRDEDLEGRPFVGRAGKLLDRMLAAIELDENDVHITNVVYWRPPGNRTPTPQEAQICRPFLNRQIELVEPEVLLLLGGAAAKAILEVEEGIMRIRGKWRDVAIGATRVRALASLHPAYLLRTPAAKRLAWRDLQALRSVLSQKNN